MSKHNTGAGMASSRDLRVGYTELLNPGNHKEFWKYHHPKKRRERIEALDAISNMDKSLADWRAKNEEV